jgi:hypothetical protein
MSAVRVRRFPKLLVAFVALLMATLIWFTWTSRQSARLSLALPIRATVEHTNNRQTASTGGGRPVIPTVATFDLTYTPAVTMERNATVSLTYARGEEVLDILQGPDARTVQPFLSSGGEVGVTLDAPDFRMQGGRETQKKRPGTRLPTNFEWILTPQKSGEFLVALDVSELTEGDQWNRGDVLKTVLSETAASLRLEDQRCCFIRFPIEVRTEWGLDAGVQRVIGAVLSVLTFLTGLAFVDNALGGLSRRWFSARSKKTQPEEPEG